MLPEVADAVGKRLTVLMDSGVRRGSDVVKALALGAKAVHDRASDALRHGRRRGSRRARAISIFREEIDRAMAHLGCRSVGEINRQCLSPASTVEKATTPTSQQRQWEYDSA